MKQCCDSASDSANLQTAMKSYADIISQTFTEIISVCPGVLCVWSQIAITWIDWYTFPHLSAKKAC